MQALIDKTHAGYSTILWWYHCPFCVITGRAAEGPNQKRLTRSLGEQHIIKDHSDLV